MSEKKKHRGRFQAQGDGLEASETWNQKEPLTKRKGLTLLNKLRNKLSDKDRELREKQFKDAERFINGSKGGVDSPLRQTFKNRKTKDARVDIEVWSGSAFVSLLALILLLLWLLQH